MPTKTSQQDFDNFTAAANQPQFGGKVSVSREVQVKLRDWAVANGVLQPAQAAPVEAYVAIIAQFIGAGVSLERTQTAEEIAQAEADAKIAEDRRKAGVVWRDSDAPNAVRKLDEFARRRDVVGDHNSEVDRALQVKQNPRLARQEQTDALLDRMNPGRLENKDIPGLVPEDKTSNTVYRLGRVSYTETENAVAAAKQKNIQTRAAWEAGREAREAAQTAASRRGI